MDCAVSNSELTSVLAALQVESSGIWLTQGQIMVRLWRLRIYVVRLWRLRNNPTASVIVWEIVPIYLGHTKAVMRFLKILLPFLKISLNASYLSSELLIIWLVCKSVKRRDLDAFKAIRRLCVGGYRDKGTERGDGQVQLDKSGGLVQKRCGTVYLN